jgi:hypothetical protein
MLLPQLHIRTPVDFWCIGSKFLKSRLFSWSFQVSAHSNSAHPQKLASHEHRSSQGDEANPIRFSREEYLSQSLCFASQIVLQSSSQHYGLCLWSLYAHARRNPLTESSPVVLWERESNRQMSETHSRLENNMLNASTGTNSSALYITVSPNFPFVRMERNTIHKLSYL